MLLHLFTLLFVALKLTAFIDWSWWFVVLPSIIAIGVPLVFFLGALVIAAIVVARDK